ncbi:hypothetical protein C7Y72_13935 [Paraconexibacter algicola]|uniref:Prepilin-type N-terminal cleavage/methylation domain-containing protein n=1 Tax=Paraconexibacter algicola TaxID=2133960 RepID=A0A2T4UE69_9ACTN|nr:hypothetical protein C7Y72_13935 [Paraconexibacter algicola]
MRDRITHARRDETGFTLVEVLVAATLLIGGLLATLTLLDSGNRTTATSKQRDVANALAQEMIERATGGRNSLARNDMTDIDRLAATPGPADRLRVALDPDGDAASTGVTPATPTAAGAAPLSTPQSWTLRRRGTTYTVSYRACTLSDAYQNVSIAGPFDCLRPATGSGGSGTGTAGSCSLELLQPQQLNPMDPGTLTARLQLLGITGLNACVGALLPDLSTALCSAVGSSNLVNTVYNGLLGAGGGVTGLLDVLGSGASVGLCPPTQVETALSGAQASIATTTRLAVTVAWTGFDGRARSISQTALVRRPVS